MENKLLIIEDDHYSVEFTKIYLSERNYIIKTALSINQAYDVLNYYIPDTVITDLNLTDGICTDLVKDLKLLGVNNIILITGFDKSQLIGMGIDISIFNFIILKPINFPELDLALKLS
jgi:DNA-binding response OmpR family regulator